MKSPKSKRKAENFALSLETETPSLPMVQTDSAFPDGAAERRRLEERLHLLESVVLSINDVILITEAEPLDLPGPRIVYVNEAFKRMTGYSIEEVTGKTPRMLQGPKTDRAKLNKIRRALEKWKPVRVEVINYRKDKSEFTVELSISPIANEQGCYTHWVSVQRETTERKKAEETLRRAKRRLQIANERLEARVNRRTAELSECNEGLQSQIAERLLAEKQLIHDAFYDALTGLPNRALFIDRLKIAFNRFARYNKRQFAVLFIDLDRFKLINDSLGHLNGDNLLIKVARRLEAVLRSCDMVARLGGDEFVVLVEEMTDPNDAFLLAQRIQSSLEQPFEIGGHELFVSASIGIALSGTGYTLPEMMMRDADVAMYRAKAGGKARTEVFDKKMHTQGARRLRLETELRRAIERDEFVIHYQPIMTLDTLQIAGFEALVRWQHPKRGLLASAEFTAIAEETGMIVPIGRWVLRKSCRQQQIWETKRQLLNPTAAPLTISVNLSCKQFLQPDLVEQVETALTETGLPASCLKLEITESCVMENTDSAIEMMNRLCALGVEFSLDDFGTGYSSLDHLHRLPVSYLKIDRSFVNRMNDNNEHCEIVKTVIVLAHNFKMQVISEGIETYWQLAQLRGMGSKFGQGYLFAQPEIVEQAESWLTPEKENFLAMFKQKSGDSELSN